jgi:hypothetical protein
MRWRSTVRLQGGLATALTSPVPWISNSISTALIGAIALGTLQETRADPVSGSSGQKETLLQARGRPRSCPRLEHRDQLRLEHRDQKVLRLIMVPTVLELRGP